MICHPTRPNNTFSYYFLHEWIKFNLYNLGDNLLIENDRILLITERIHEDIAPCNTNLELHQISILTSREAMLK